VKGLSSDVVLEELTRLKTGIETDSSVLDVASVSEPSLPWLASVSSIRYIASTFINLSLALHFLPRSSLGFDFKALTLTKCNRVIILLPCFKLKIVAYSALYNEISKVR